MKVISQKNVYYVDLNKSLYRGYIETAISRESGEKSIVFKSTHLAIESATVQGYDKELKIEFFNSKSAKQKSPKTGKIAIVIKNSVTQASPDEKQLVSKKLTPILQESCSASVSSEEAQSSFYTLPTKFIDSFTVCCDSFRLRIPDSIVDLALNLRIVFKPAPNNPSIIWYKPVSGKDKHREVLACNFYDNSSAIFPYVDTITNFNIFFIIPNTEDSKVISSGSLRSVKEEDKNIVYLYSICSHPRYFSFAVGSFTQNDIFSDSDKRRIFAPCCVETDLAEVTADVQSIIKYIEGFTRTKELATCNIIFSMINASSFAAHNMAIINYSHFPSTRDIEMSYYLKRILCDLLSAQVYHFLNWCSYDLWIDIGFSGYLSDYCIRHLLGNNEFLCSYYEDKKFVVSNDIVEPPLFYTLRREFDCQTEFFRKKAKLLFHCMESHLSYAFLQKISDEVLENRKIKFEAEGASFQETDLFAMQTDCYISLKRCFTSPFMKIVKDVSGKDLKSFFDFYLFRPGLMNVRLNFQINKKKNSVRATMTYSPTSLLPKANKKILSMIDIKSIELEGNFDHTVANESETIFVYHTRTKKKKKEDEEEVMPLLYIRIDPKRLNLFDYIADQPDYMHIEQLQDKNVIGQLESIQSLSLKPTIASCEALERLIDNSHVFYKVRVNAAYALRTTSIEGYAGLQRIIKYFIKNRCVPNSTILKANEFGLIPYFIQKHLVQCISLIDLKNEDLLKDSKVVLSFYENLLKFNDNSLSKFDDSWYISSAINLFALHTVVMTSLNIQDYESMTGSEYFNHGFSKLIEQNGNQTSSIEDFFKSKSSLSPKQKVSGTINNSQLIEKCVDILERFRISDLVFPSNNNVITRICLLSFIRLAFYNKIKISKESLKNLSLYPNLLSIRVVAIEGLLLLHSDSIRFLLDSLTNEVPSVIQSFLDVLIRVFSLDLRVHFQDTEEFDVKLSDRIRQDIERNADLLIEIYKSKFIHCKINDQIRKLLSLIDSRSTLISEIPDLCIKKYDVIKEESSRVSLLKAPSTSRRIRVADLNALREAIFIGSYTIRIPRIKNFKAKSVKDIPLKHLKIRILPTRFLVKHIDNHLIRFKISRSKLRARKTDIPVVILNKYRQNRHSLMIDDFIVNNKSTGFFPWEARTSLQILESIREQKLSSSQTFNEIERSLIFVLSYNTPLSKPYLTAKSLYAIMESIFFEKAFIVEKIALLTPEIRQQCFDFVTHLSFNPKFEAFQFPVDTKELKNYLDIVRVPMSFYDLQNNLPNYGSFEAFIVHLERIYINCLNFNDSRSLIVEYAFELKSEIDMFKSSLVLEYSDSMQVIKELIDSNNSERLLEPVLENLPNVASWGDIDEMLVILKKKYSRSSHSGKLVVSLIKQVREAFKNIFLVDAQRVLVLPD